MTEVYYARHVHDWNLCDIEGATINYLLQEKAIAIHFKGIASWESESYRGQRNQGPSAIQHMNRCNGDEKDIGGYDSPITKGDDVLIFASYKTRDGQKVFMGRPKLGSKSFQRARLQGWPEDTHIKILFLDEVREVKPDEFPYAFLLAPKQSTFVHWKQCEPVINRWLHGQGPDTSDPKTYLPASIEVLCEEYLREEDLSEGHQRESLLTRKLTRTGGNLKFFDIIGIGPDDKLVYAQVKERSDQGTVEKFKARCEKVDPAGRYFFFAESLDSATVPGVEIISIRDVLGFFSERGEDSYLETLARQAWPTIHYRETATPPAP